MQKSKATKYRIIIVSIAVLGVFIFLGLKIYHGFLNTQGALTEVLPSTYSLTSEDSNLIGEKYRDKLEVNEVYQSKIRNPVSLISFDKRYNLLIHKIHLSGNDSLNNFFHTEIKSVDRTTGVTYIVIDNNLFFQFQYKSEPIKAAQDIYLTLSGDSLQTVAKNDSIISYHLLCHNLSVRYAMKEPIDIFVIGKEKGLGTTITIPIDILFLKQNENLYLLLMTPIDSKSSIEPDLLYNIVTGN
jgi:hypothetical protein